MNKEAAAPIPPGSASVGRYASRAAARERSAVLLAKGITHWSLEIGEGVEVFVEPAAADFAQAQLLAYDTEQAETAAVRPLPGPPHYATDRLSLALAALGLIAMHGWIYNGHEALIDRWCRDSVQIFRAGEWWRTASALWVHEDWAHLVSNLFFGGVFTLFVSRALGRGVGVGLVFLSGVLGNLLTAALWYPEPYRAIGASTAVFGAVGLLVGHGMVWARREHGLRRHRPWLLPFGSGVALLGVFGSGGERTGVDLTAHLFGFVAGLVLGCFHGLLARRRAR